MDLSFAGFPAAEPQGRLALAQQAAQRALPVCEVLWSRFVARDPAPRRPESPLQAPKPAPSSWLPLTAANAGGSEGGSGCV